MRRVNRARVNVPPALACYDHRTCCWDTQDGRRRFGGADKAQVRAALESMQSKCCAYCEAATYESGHIEHFRRKNAAHFPELMFVWENLFLSCDALDHCGHHKDRAGRPYDPKDLVKPDEQDPHEYFYFHSSGEIRVRSGLDIIRRRQALETIRVFHLDCGVLTAARRRAVEAYQSRDPSMLDDLETFDEPARLAFIESELNETADDPHSSVIRHLFEKVR